MNSRFLSNLFHSLSENVNGLLDRLRPAKTEKKDLLLQLAETLLSRRGEASDVAVASEFLAAYNGLTEIEGLSFLTLLDRQFGPDQARLERALRNIQDQPTFPRRSPPCWRTIEIPSPPAMQRLPLSIPSPIARWGSRGCPWATSSSSRWWRN